MLNIFPILWLSLFAHSILRITVGAALIFLSLRHARAHPNVKDALATIWPPFAPFMAWQLVVVELVIGIFFIFGFLTQIAAIAAFILSIKMLILRRRLSYPLVPSPLFYVMLLGASISLFITGAGAIAIDIPL